MSNSLPPTVSVGRGRGSKVTLDNLSTTSKQEMARLREDSMDTFKHEDTKPTVFNRRQGWRSLHESTFTLADSTETNYTTVMTESYCGRDTRGQPLIFFHRDPQFPSQHTSTLRFCNTSTTYTPTHSRDVHSPKDIIPHNVLRSYGLRNWSRSHEGLAMKAITNPSGSTLYQSSCHDSHQNPSMSISHRMTTMGYPTPWHSHDILTGEEKRPAGPGKPKRTVRDESLWAQRRWETDSGALRLY